jgi:hypothetical protein
LIDRPRQLFAIEAPAAGHQVGTLGSAPEPGGGIARIIERFIE